MPHSFTFHPLVVVAHSIVASQPEAQALVSLLRIDLMFALHILTDAAQTIFYIGQ